MVRWHLSLTHTDAGGHGHGGRRRPAGAGPGLNGDPLAAGGTRSRSVTTMLPVLTVSEMSEVDAAALASTPLEVLVARAGLAVALAAMDMLGGAYGRRVVVVAGRGNNGADGRVAASLLRRRGAPGSRVVEAGTGDTIGPADLVIDAAYGTGFRGEYRSPVPGPGDPGAGRRHPLGGAGRHRGGVGHPDRRPGARSPSWPSSPASSRATGPAWPAGCRWPTSASPPAARPSRSWRTPTWSPCSLGVATAATSGPAAVHGGGRLPRDDRGRRASAPGRPTGRGPGWSASACPVRSCPPPRPARR